MLLLAAMCLPLTLATSQGATRHPTYSALVARTPLPSQTVQRVGQFLDELAAAMPTLLREGLVGERRGADMRPLGRFESLAYVYDYRAGKVIPADPARSLVALDSLRKVWETTDTIARAYWFIPNALHVENGSRILVALLSGVVQNGTLVDPATRLANALQHVDAMTAGAAADAIVASPDSIADIRPIVRAQTSSVAHWTGVQLLAMIQLAQGDTSAAMKGLREVMRENDDLGLRAAFTLEQLATARHDTVTLAEVTGMLVMKLGGMPKDKIAMHQRFVALYPAWRRQNPQLPADPEQYLDHLFPDLFDHDIPVTRYTASHHRMAILEYRTGLGCGACWGHDRVAAALMQRYPADALAILAYEYQCPPLSNEIDSPQSRLEEWYPHAGLLMPFNTSHVVQFGKLSETDFEPRKSAFPLRMADPWIDGLPMLDPEGSFLDRKYRQYAARIDSLLALPPEAVLALHVTTHGDMVEIGLTVDSVRATHPHVAARITLVQDTVRVMGATNRRLQYAVVRAAAQAPGLPIGVPLTGKVGGHQTAHYRFDLAALAAQYVSQRTPAATLRRLYPVDSIYKQQLAQKERMWDAWVSALPDPADSRIDRNRLHVVAFIQDLDTGEILQATRVSLAPSTGPVTANRSAHL
jgi:hypothetical protein